MTLTLPLGLRRAVGPWLAAALLLASHLAAPGRSSADDAPKVRLLLSDKAGDKKPKAPDADPQLNFLRPNVAQELFTYVENTDKAVRNVTVEVLSNGVPVASKKVEVPAGATREVRWPEAAGVKPGAPPALKALQAPVALRILDEKGAIVGDQVPVEVDRPSRYLTTPTVTYYPGDKGKNRLIVSVSPRADRFKGPPCKVELVLRPDRIPVLLPGQLKRGRHENYLTASTKTLYLTAEDLRLSGGGSGLVYLTVDGYERAFTFWVTFAPGRTESVGQRVNAAGLAMVCAAATRPTSTFRVGVEADDFTEAPVLKLEVETPLPPEAKAEEGDRWSQLAEVRGQRSRRMLFAAGGRRGGLLFQPEVKDWSREIDLSEAHGRSRLRLRSLNAKGTTIQVLDKAALAAAGASDKADVTAELGKRVSAVTRTVLVDGSDPEGVAFVKPPKQAIRGKSVVLQATGSDPESGISGVVFYVGKAPAGGKVPADAVQVEALRDAKDSTAWAAALPVAKDQRDPMPVTAVFTNGVGLTKAVALTLKVVDPEALGEGKKKKASISGEVVEGDRQQVGIPVQLTDAAGRALLATTTGKGGAFLFEDLEPGTYRVVATKSASRTRGTVPVVLKAEEQKKDVQVKLYR